MKVFIVLVLALTFISCANGFVTDSEIYEHCSKKHNGPLPEYKDKFHNADFTDADEDKAKCFVNCMYKEFSKKPIHREELPSLVHEDGSLNANALKYITPAGVVHISVLCFLRLFSIFFLFFRMKIKL